MTLADLLSCPCKAPKQMHLATTKPDKALQGILQDPVLSDSSKHTYAQRLRAISAKLGQPISELAMQPMTILPWIKQRHPEVATQKNVVTAVLAALRRMPAMKKQHRQALAIWLRASKELEAQQQARLKANEPCARQQRGYVDFKAVIKVRTTLAKGSRQRLLLAFYTMIPPLRCDLNRVALLQCPASAATISPAQRACFFLDTSHNQSCETTTYAKSKASSGQTNIG